MEEIKSNYLFTSLLISSNAITLNSFKNNPLKIYEQTNQLIARNKIVPFFNVYINESKFPIFVPSNTEKLNPDGVDDKIIEIIQIYFEPRNISFKDTFGMLPIYIQRIIINVIKEVMLQSSEFSDEDINIYNNNKRNVSINTCNFNDIQFFHMNILIHSKNFGQYTIEEKDLIIESLANFDFLYPMQFILTHDNQFTKWFHNYKGSQVDTVTIVDEILEVSFC